jgi:aminoglycoside 6'-N-acetyltransferase
MAHSRYEFRSMTAADLPMVRRWLTEPHVVEWWGDAAEQFELVRGDLEHPGMDQLIISTDGRPFGYLQCYDLTAWPDEAFGIQPPGTHAIDQFIGEPDMIDRGHGSGFIRAFVDGVLATGAPRVLTDPDVANARAIRAYAKAGFHRDRVVNTLEGPALLMVRDA